MNYSIWNILANPEASQIAVLASYLLTFADAAAAQAITLESATPVQREKVIAARQERDYWRRKAALVRPPR